MKFIIIGIGIRGEWGVLATYNQVVYARAGTYEEAEILRDMFLSWEKSDCISM